VIYIVARTREEAKTYAKTHAIWLNEWRYIHTYKQLNNIPVQGADVRIIDGWNGLE